MCVALFQVDPSLILFCHCINRSICSISRDTTAPIRMVQKSASQSSIARSQGPAPTPLLAAQTGFPEPLSGAAVN